MTPKIARKSFKWTVEALAALHEGSEARIITILKKANLTVIHAGHVTLMLKDIDLAMKLSNVTENYKTTSSVTEVESKKEKNENEERRRKELEVQKKKRNPEKEDNAQSSGSGSGIVMLFRPIISDEDGNSLDTVSEEEEVVITRGQKHQQVESSESEEEMFQETPRKNVRCSKKLTKEQFDFFEANGFTDELITIVADEGWDRVDIENFVLLYNHQNRKHVALLIFDRDKTIYGKRGKEDGSTNKRGVKSGSRNSNKNGTKKENKISKGEDGTKNDHKAGKSGTGGKACSSQAQMNRNYGKESKGRTSKKGENLKESKGGKSGTHGKTSSSEEEMSRKKDGKETKCTGLKRGINQRKVRQANHAVVGKKVVVNWKRVGRRQRKVKQAKVGNLEVTRMNQEKKGEG